MWDKIRKYQTGFHSAVLSLTGPDGYPASWRVIPETDPSTQVIRLDAPPTAELCAGPASLLFHSHDERLWNLRSFNIKGRLSAETTAGWVFHPERVIPGVSVEGPMGYVKFLRNGQQGTRRFFEKRGQPVPPIDWEELMKFLMPG